jgi:hypothetical protein
VPPTSYQNLPKSAILLTVDVNGNQVSNPFSMQMWLTGSNIQFSGNQTHHGMQYLPIRRSEQFIQFTALWAHQHYADMDQFLVNIRNHHLYTLTTANPQPMTLVYSHGGFEGSPLSYNGFVTGVTRGDARYTALYTKTFNMEMIMPLNTPTATVTQSGGFIPTSSFFSSNQAGYFIPTTANAGGYGTGWINIVPGTSKTATTTPSSQPSGIPGKTTGFPVKAA